MTAGDPTPEELAGIAPNLSTGEARQLAVELRTPLELARIARTAVAGDGELYDLGVNALFDAVGDLDLADARNAAAFLALLLANASLELEALR